MTKSIRGSWQRFEQARAARERLHLHSGEHIAGDETRRYRAWQRVVSALVAATLFIGPITVTVEQGRMAAGVLAAGDRRLSDDAWREIQDLAQLRIRFAMQAAEAAAITDPTAPISFQPKITQSTGSGGGVPVVNITAPNAAGISLNQYQTFNVDPVGLILNNSLQGGTTLTGGNVTANPNLNGRTASMIVNQVTSTGTAFMSVLNGPLEVFGAPATVIIANPNGIAVRGAGFTNTIGVTLTTGTPRFLTALGGTQTDFTNAQAVAYDVKGGHIQIEGNAGTNGPGAGIEGTVGTIDLIGETVGINAPLYAGTRINVIAGDQVVSPAATGATGTTYATQSNGSANNAASIGNATQGYAIDATNFGAMTAGQIAVIGTAQGMGVRTDAALSANAGNLTLSSNGDLTAGNHAAQQEVSITSAGNTTLSGTGLGVGGYQLSAGGDVTSGGTLQSQATLSVVAGGNVNIANAQSAGDMTMTGGANVTAANIQTGGNLSVAAQGAGGGGDVTLNGTNIVTGSTTLTAARDIDADGQFASGALQATAQRDVNVNSALQGSSDIALTAKTGNVNIRANINGASNLAMSAGQAIAIDAQATAQHAVSLAAGAVSVNGSLASGTTLNANATGAFGVAGSLMVGTDASIDAASIDVPGVFIAQGNGVMNSLGDMSGTGSIAFGQSGTLASGQDITLAGKLLSNGLQVTAANSVTLASVQAGGAFSVVANGKAGGGDVTLNGSTAAVGATSVQAARDVIVNGTLAGGAQVEASAQRNVTVATTGTIQSIGDLTVTATKGEFQSNGTVNSGGKLSASAAGNLSLNGSTTVTGDASLTAGQDLVNTGTLAGQSSASLRADHDVSLGGTSGFTSDVAVSAAHDLSVSGFLQGNNVTLNAANSAVLNNVQANAALSISALGNATGGDVNVNGLVTSQSGTTLTAAGKASITGSLASSGALNVSSALDTSISGTAKSNGSMTLASTSGSLTSTGVVESGTDLTINAARSINLGTNSTSALGNMSLTAGQDIVTNGTVVAQGTGALKAGGTISGAASLAFGLDASLISTGDTALTGSLRGATVQTSAGGNSTLNNVQAGSVIALGATGNLSLTGTLAGGSTVALTAGNDINVSGSLQSTGDMTLAALGGNIGLAGSLSSNGNLLARAGSDVNFGGTTTVALDTTLQGGRDVNVTGAVNGQGNGTIVAGRNVGGNGTIGFAQAANLTAGGDIAQGGLVQGKTVVAAAGGDAVVNNIESASSIGLSAGNATIGGLTVNGTVGAAGAVTATATGGMAVAANGKIAAGTTTALTALSDIVVAGAIESNGNMSITSQFGSLNATGGINSGGALGITTGIDLALGTSTSAIGDATLSAGRDAALGGTFVGQGNGYIIAGRDITGAGTQAFANAAVLAAQRNISLSGSLQGNSIQATGGDNAGLNNATSSTTLKLTALGLGGNGDASVTGATSATGAISLNAARDVVVTGAVGSNATLTMSAQRNVTTSGSATSAGDLNVTATNGSATFGGSTTATGALNVASGLDTQLGGNIAVSGNVGVQAGRDVQLTGALAGQGTGTLTSGHDITGAGSAAFAQTTTLQSAHDIALTGSLQGSSVTATAGNSAGFGSVQAVTGNFVATANGTGGAGDITFSRAATAQGAMTLQAARDVIAVGSLSAGGATSITAQRNVGIGSANSTGDIAIGAGGSLAVSGIAITNGNLNASAGNDLWMGAALASGAMNLSARGANGAGDVAIGGLMGSGGIANVSAARDISVGGDVSTGDKLTLTAGRNLSVGGSIDAGGDTNLTGTAGNIAVIGTTSTVGNLNAQAAGSLAMGGGLVNGGTTLSSGGTTTLTGMLAGLNAANINAGGSITGGGNLTFGGDIGLNAGSGIALGAIQGAGQFTATANGDMSFGAATTVGNVTATSHNGSVAFNGALQTGGNARIQAANDATVAGGIASMGATNVTGTNGNVSIGGVSSNGDATLTAGKTLTLSGTSVVAGQLALTGGNVTLTGTASGSKSIDVSAQDTLDASKASLVATQNLRASGTNVTLGNAIVGGTLTVQASNQLSLVGSAIDVVGAASLSSQNGLTNATNVLAGGGLSVSAGNLTNLANGSFASTGTTSIQATNFANAGLVNGATTTVNVAGALTNSGSLMGLSALTINTGSLNNQSGLIFAGDPNTPNAPTKGDVALTINGGGSAFNNVGGQLLAQRNLALSAVNAAIDPSQGTINQGGQLSITAGSISVNGTWNYGGQSVAINGLNGITNSGTMTGAAPLTISTGGTFTNLGNVAGNDVTFNGTLYNAANAVMHAGDVLALNGNTTNRGTVEAVNAVNVTGGSYDNQGATTQAQGNVNLNLSAALLNTGGSVFAGNNLTVNAASVVNDQTAPTGQQTITTAVVDPSVLWSGAVGTKGIGYEYIFGGDGGELSAGYNTVSATLGDLLAPTGSTTNSSPTAPEGHCFDGCSISASQPVAGSGSVTFNEYDGVWVVGTIAGGSLQASRTFVLPTVYETTTTQQPGVSGTLSAGNAIALTAGSLSNQGGQIAAQGSVTLNIQSLSNGAVAPTLATQSTTFVSQSDYSAFLSQLRALGTIEVQGTGNSTGAFDCDSAHYCFVGSPYAPTTFQIVSGSTAPSATGSLTASTATGMIAAGSNVNIASVGNLVNAGLIYAGNNVQLLAGTLTNEGGNQQSYSSQVGCASGVAGYACGNGGSPRGTNPVTTTFSYSQNDATIYAGNDLVVAAGQVNNTYGNLLAGHDIVIGGIGSTANSTTPAQSLNNTSGNIVAGNNITLNVSGAITNNLPPPVPVHENYGSKEQYSGCMTAGGYKESYCEGYVDQQSGSSSVISAGNNLQIAAGTLTNIGSLIAAGNSATINVTGPVVNEAQTLNAYWHSHWVQETGMFSSDKRHDIWACGSAAECTALYGSAYTSTGGTIDPPQPVGNIAATIQAPNLSISSNGQIQNVGNVIGTSVSLTGQRLINGITTANTYTPRVNNPSQVISLSPVDLPGLNLAMPRSVGTGKLPTPVAGQASYVDASLGASAVGFVGPQDLIQNLPSNLQPSSTLFYYNPQEENLLLQQAALQQTGKASFVDGLTFDSKNNISVTDQEKAYLYQNAIDYAKANDIQLGDALTQQQVSALDKPMLWYVEQTVPDPSCKATGTATCPTITALMPQVYLPTNTAAMSAGGNIEGQDVTLNFDKDGNGSVLNTGTISASNTLTVNTNTLTNEANQVDVGQIWEKVKGGYIDTTGTEVQPGGFMSAANMDLNVQTLNQVGGALQQLNADGTVDQAGTQQTLAALQQQLGDQFTQTSVTDHLHTDFVKDGGGLPMFVVAAIAIAASIVTAGAAAAAFGVAMAQLSIGSVLIGALGGMVGSAVSQVASGQGLNFGQILQAGAIGAITAGAFAAMGASTQALQQFGSKIANGTVGLADIGNAVQVVIERGVVTATAESAIEGANFGQALEGSAISDLGAIGASAIGTEFDGQNEHPDINSPLYVGSHAVLGCALSAAQGTGCVGGAIGGAVSAASAETIAYEVTGGQGNPNSAQLAAITSLSMLAGGGLAAALGQNADGAASAAENETLNNTCGSDDPHGCGKALGLVGTLAGGAGAFLASLFADTATEGLNLPATLEEVVAGAKAGRKAGTAVGNSLDSMASKSTSDGAGGSSAGSTGSGQSAEGTGGGTNATGSTPPKVGLYKGATQETIDKINQVIQVAEDTTTGSGTKNFTMPTQSSRQAAFDYLAEGAEQATIETPKGPIQSATLADGTKVVSRPFSSSMSGNTPTIQIIRPGGGTALEIRFPQ
ncbi:filamentous hemagglutinin N-terminal domain-containing protein [Trinickia diaoshuihuensis]|uniref:two-partner secretion domain-containing protein n=1 Tax=Trinickia diaoshuihuensis TaxID=2292265 RepID=UPI000E271EBA|nr:filamentous hemagglutinin N-terminal domain-containing protein [Trinickia diaoshuihuensis]